MLIRQILEHKKGIKAVKYNKKPKAHTPAEERKVIGPDAPKKKEEVAEGRDGNDVEEFLHKVAQSGDNGFDMLYNAQQGKYGREIERAIQDMYEDISIDTGYHGDDDFEQIYDRMLDNIEADYGQQGVAEVSVTKKPQPYNEPNWTKKLPKEKLDAVAGPRYKKDKKETGVTEGPTDDPRFQKMMGKIQKSTPTPMSGYVALSFASEGRSKKIKGVKHNGKPMPDVIDDPEEFLGGNIEFTPDQIEQKLMSIGEKYGWDSIDPGQGQGYTEMFFDTSREYTSKNQSRLAANIVRTVNEINKFFNNINRSLQSTGLPGYTTDVWQGMGPSDDINQIEDLTQIISIAKKQDVTDMD